MLTDYFQFWFCSQSLIGASFGFETAVVGRFLGVAFEQEAVDRGERVQFAFWRGVAPGHVADLRSPTVVLRFRAADAQPLDFTASDLGELVLPALSRLGGEQYHEPVPGLAELVLVAVHEGILELKK
jgi:hypothetical protein